MSVIENRCYISSFLIDSSLASSKEMRNGKFLNECQALQEEDAEESLEGLRHAEQARQNVMRLKDHD